MVPAIESYLLHKCVFIGTCNKSLSLPVPVTVVNLPVPATDKWIYWYLLEKPEFTSACYRKVNLLYLLQKQ